jgi:hypothetical protein
LRGTLLWRSSGIGDGAGGVVFWIREGGRGADVLQFLHLSP